MRRSFGLVALFWSASAILPAAAAETDTPDAPALLAARCGGCHGAKLQLSGLALHDEAHIRQGSQSGPVVVPGAPQDSLLLKRVREGSMPPGGKNRLSDSDIATLESWIRSLTPAAPAAPAAASLIKPEARKFWSFMPLAQPTPPAIQPATAVATPIDAFLLARLQQKDLSYAKAASRATLIRRAYLDLTGLPPTPAEIDEFVSSKAADPYPALIEKLLASPQFGERWARHWLDLAGYVDTVGRDVQSDGYKVGEGRWRYRDYVIHAFQQDKPYNQFLTEQIAGDELFDWRSAKSYTPAQVDMLTATGFLRTVEDPTDNAERDFPIQRYEVLHQTIDILSSSVMGLTVGCARCHNHKFDPITQKDYYGLMAVLTPAYNPVKWTPVLERKLADVPPSVQSAIDEHNSSINKQIQTLQTDGDKLLREVVTPLIEAPLAKLPEDVRNKTRNAALVPPRKRNANQQRLIKALEVDLSEPALIARLSTDYRERYTKLQTDLKALRGQLQQYGTLEALYDTGAPPETFIHRRGDFESKGATVDASGLEVLMKPGTALVGAPVPGVTNTSGRRRALANWLTAEGTPAASLVARVYVNRAWMYLFGQGIVPTSENFGKMGQTPTNPELLEWLATDFIRSGWSTKHLLRTIVLSRAYQQSSVPAENPAGLAAATKADPENTLLWHMPLRRLESEVIRDSMLSIAGTLNPKAGGPPVKTIAQPDGMVVVDEKAVTDATERNRRSIYLVARRRYNLSMLGVFDHPVMSTNAVTRGSSAVVLQSLMMMNDMEVLTQSEHFAERISRESGASADTPSRLALAYRYAFGRKPDAEEKQWTLALYQREQERLAKSGKPEAAAQLQALASVCHVLLNANEFLYVE